MTQVGDLWIFDNQRILHARGAAGPRDGERWLQGAYVDRSLLWYHWEKYRRERATQMLGAMGIKAATESETESETAGRRADRLAPGGAFTTLADGTKAELEEMGRVYKERVDGVTHTTLLAMLSSQVSLFYLPLTFCANPAHNLTRSPYRLWTFVTARRPVR